MRIRVLYFAAARERVGSPSETLELAASPEQCTLALVREAIFERHPSLRPLAPHLRYAVNQVFAEPELPVPDGAEIALIPPVAGGSEGGRSSIPPLPSPFRVLETPLALEEVVRHVESPRTGGVVTFTGRVRDNTRGRAVVRLEYEAYVPMAERFFASLGEEVASRWPETVLAIHHRVGTLTPGEVAVVIAAAAPHRKEAFRACEHAIERLKEDAPIWKREVYADGAVWVGLGP